MRINQNHTTHCARTHLHQFGGASSSPNCLRWTLITHFTKLKFGHALRAGLPPTQHPTVMSRSSSPSQSDAGSGSDWNPSAEQEERQTERLCPAKTPQRLKMKSLTLHRDSIWTGLWEIIKFGGDCKEDPL